MSEFNRVLNKKAAALKYDETREAAPVIVASGMGYMAEKIVETAVESGVPVYEDNSLATILTQLELGSEIPEELYRTVVDIYLYFLKFVPRPKKEAEAAAQTEDAATQAEETGEPGDSGMKAAGASEVTSTLPGKGV